MRKERKTISSQRVKGMGNLKLSRTGDSARALAAELEEADDLIIPIEEGVFGEHHIAADIGEVLDERAEGRQSADQITCFKSAGNAVQDVAVGPLAVREAERKGLGRTVDL